MHTWISCNHAMLAPACKGSDSTGERRLATRPFWLEPTRTGEPRARARESGLLHRVVAVQHPHGGRVEGRLASVHVFAVRGNMEGSRATTVPVALAYDIPSICTTIADALGPDGSVVSFVSAHHVAERGGHTCLTTRQDGFQLGLCELRANVEGAHCTQCPCPSRELPCSFLSVLRTFSTFRPSRRCRTFRATAGKKVRQATHEPSFPISSQR